MSLLQWLKQSFVGPDGTASSRRLTSFWFVVLATLNHTFIAILGYLIIMQVEIIPATPIDPKQLEVIDRLILVQYVNCGMILLLFGIVTFQQISDFKNGRNIEVTKETTTDKVKETTKIQGDEK